MPTCKKCGQIFPNQMVIDGKTRVLRNRDFCLDCSPFGKHNNRDLTKEPNKPGMKVCTLCKTEQSVENFYKKTGGKIPLSYCKNCFNLRVAQRTHRIKQEAIEYKGGKCQRCGYDRCFAALEFHHLDPQEKDIQISKYHNRTLERLKPELDKCILLCSNCHREIHKGRDMDEQDEL